MSHRRKSINALDRRLVEHAARIPSSPADDLLRELSLSANHSKLWMAVAAGLFVAGGRAQRRGAVRGLVAVGLASALANGVAKPLFPRRRPPVDAVPELRRLVKPPRSSSFPSGHSASAAAFTTAVALESPATAAVLAPVAAAVAYSRVHIGVHWPSDVVVGAALGSGVALATRRWWAVRADEPASLGPAKRLEPLPAGRGLLLVVNPASGSGTGTESLDQLRERLPEAQVLEVGDGDLDAAIEDRVRRHGVTALGVLGGDGTVSALAETAVQHGLPLAVFAGGTLNHFARDVGVEDPETTFTALDSGQVVLVDTARVQLDDEQDRMFVNTASLGGYPDFVRLRERWERRIGKWPAAGFAMLRVLFRAAPLRAEIDGERSALWMLFVGNGAYHPADQIPMSRPRLHDGIMDIRYLRADLRFSRTRLIWATFTGTLDRSTTYVHRRVARLDVQVDGAPVSLATDGEVNHRAQRLAFASCPAALAVFREPDEQR
ncbi:bifunctional phosphatase PAP2/diacylglycerol kinase family protein [Nocardia brasiliensis]|uniref:bifunctional phosphatase PAP2/diacylglycerol kinase family protein n=1 Tax=Nocardia brasiliensis TaxID=37326 RepID=UPI001892E3A3|nr:bifunctional phosphatase PAP2/diacylglycerol kinase family protein [Nocardia brasiliensis]MBF6125971.1 phosphatase PAP2 family protein [Nocardia brasiliensis]